MKKTILTIMLCVMIFVVGCSNTQNETNEVEPELPEQENLGNQETNGQLDEKTSEEALDEVLEEVALTVCDENGDSYEKSLCFLESLSTCEEDTLILDLFETKIAPEGTFFYEIKGSTDAGCEVTVRNENAATWSNTCSLKPGLFVDCVLSEDYLAVLQAGLGVGIDDQSMVDGLFLIGSNPGCVGDLKDTIDQCVKG